MSLRPPSGAGGRSGVPHVPGSRTQNYFPTFDCFRLSTKAAAELGLSRLPWLVP